MPNPPQRLGDVSSTYEFTSFVMQHGLADTGFEVIGYEINSMYAHETCTCFQPSSQPPKLEEAESTCLCGQRSKRMPVVGEVKVKDDKNAFFGLLQAMTYAAELSTPNQLELSANAYSTIQGSLAVENATVEIAVIQVNPVNDLTIVPKVEVNRTHQRASEMCRACPCSALSKTMATNGLPTNDAMI